MPDFALVRLEALSSGTISIQLSSDISLDIEQSVSEAVELGWMITPRKAR